MGEKNPLYAAMEEMVEQLRGIKPPTVGPTAIPFGKEKLPLRDRANRTFGENGMTSQELKQEFEEMVATEGPKKAREEIVNRARTFQRQQRPLPKFGR